MISRVVASETEKAQTGEACLSGVVGLQYRIKINIRSIWKVAP